MAVWWATPPASPPSVYHRGIAVVQAPTTLLAQVDAAIGGKTAVNLPEGKNLVGAFHQPLAVYADVSTLATLPPREYRAGLGEVAKYALMPGGERVATLVHEHAAAVVARDVDVLTELVAACAAMKAHVVAADPLERTGLRATLNLGHTLAHALESVGGYELLHGEAVAVGLVFAGALAGALERIDGEAVAHHRNVVAALDLPTAVPGPADPRGVAGLDAPRQEVGRRPHLRAAGPDGPRDRPRPRRARARRRLPRGRGGGRCGRLRNVPMPTILLLSGPNLNLLGDREPEIYGTTTLADLVELATKTAADHGYELEHVQSNHEGDLVDAIHGARGRCAAIVINAGAFTHYSFALADALATFEGVKVELHISNPEAREHWRHDSVISPYMTATMAGFGAAGYRLAVEGAIAKVESS